MVGRLHVWWLLLLGCVACDRSDESAGKTKETPPEAVASRPDLASLQRRRFTSSNVTAYLRDVVDQEGRCGLLEALDTLEALQASAPDDAAVLRSALSMNYGLRASPQDDQTQLLRSVEGIKFAESSGTFAADTATTCDEVEASYGAYVRKMISIEQTMGTPGDALVGASPGNRPARRHDAFWRGYVTGRLQASQVASQPAEGGAPNEGRIPREAP